MLGWDQSWNGKNASFIKFVSNKQVYIQFLEMFTDNFYHPHPNIAESNVFSRVCLSTGGSLSRDIME